MASNYSDQPTLYATPESEKAKVCCISLNKGNRIRLCGVPPGMCPILRETIKVQSGCIIQEERDYHGTYEFKLGGSPWEGTQEESVMARRLIARILISMANHGWNLIQSSDVSKRPGSKDILFFENGRPDPEVGIFSISFNRENRIRMIDGPPNVMELIKEAVRTQWQNGIQDEGTYFGSSELKLNGNPWVSTGVLKVHCGLLLSQILANLRAAGFKLYGSVDVSSKKDYGRYTVSEEPSLESWFFRKVGPLWQ